MKVLILGVGGLGGFFGAHLQKTNCDVTFLVRENTKKLVSERGIKILSDLALSKSKTSLLQDKIKKFDAKSILFIGGKKIEKNFLNASKNIPNIDVLPSQGLNVYNILRRDYLFISEDALNFINERFKDG